MVFSLRMMSGLSFAFSAALLVLAVLVPVVGHYLGGRALLEARPAPAEWIKAAEASDMLEVPGYPVAYWAKPDGRYSVGGTLRQSKPQAVVVHYTYVRPVLAVVASGHRRDFSRGGHVYGYHFYVGRGGGIVQGAPLSKRTNHIKSKARPQRKPVARHLWSGNTIALSLVGGCDALLRPSWRRWGMCAEEYVTEAQLKAGLALIRAIQERYDIPCAEVYGHGDLQSDRASFEGATLTRMARETCAEADSSS